MPVTISVGFNRKMGEPNYGSRGASVNLQIEREAALLADPAALTEQVDALFELARGCVESELTESAPQSDAAGSPPSAASSGSASDSPARLPLTPRQRRTIEHLVQREQLNMDHLLQHYAQGRPLAQVTRAQASRLITDLYAQSTPLPEMAAS